MVTYRARGETVAQTETVQLQAQFYGFDGQPADLTAFPSVTIVEPSGNVAIGPTTVGVYRLSTGLYGFDYAVGYNASLGIYTDIWQGNLDGYTVSGTFNFVVFNTQLPAINSDGYMHLGDDPGYHFSQTSILNINKLLKVVKGRLNSSGKKSTLDEYGNQKFVDCDIYTVDTLVGFLITSLSDFNQIPFYTAFTFDDTEFVAQFFEVLVQGAVLYALASKALIERGREYTLTDNGVSFSPPTISEALNTQWNAELTNHFEKLKYIKNSMRPHPMGLGLLSANNGAHPAIARMRHVRQRKLF